MLIIRPFAQALFLLSLSDIYKAPLHSPGQVYVARSFNDMLVRIHSLLAGNVSVYLHHGVLISGQLSKREKIDLFALSGNTRAGPLIRALKYIFGDPPLMSRIARLRTDEVSCSNLFGPPGGNYRLCLWLVRVWEELNHSTLDLAAEMLKLQLRNHGIVRAQL